MKKASKKWQKFQEEVWISWSFDTPFLDFLYMFRYTIYHLFVIGTMRETIWLLCCAPLFFHAEHPKIEDVFCDCPKFLGLVFFSQRKKHNGRAHTGKESTGREEKIWPIRSTSGHDDQINPQKMLRFRSLQEKGPQFPYQRFFFFFSGCRMSWQRRNTFCWGQLSQIS